MTLPSFYQAQQLEALYVERAGLVADSAREARRTRGIKPAAQDDFRIAAFGIDVQVGFCSPQGSLFVPGAVEDSRRVLEWLYRNVGVITDLHFSLDTHQVFQIFHPAWWVDREGRPPAPLTTITSDQIRRGDWTPVAHPRESLEYTERLERSGKYVLTVWPFHALQGGVSHALVPAVMEAAIFHAVARERPTHVETKGTHPLTENYSVLSPEVTELGGAPVGEFNARLFELLLGHDRIYVFGQAKSHCVLSTLRDLEARIQATDPRLMDKVWILEDAMSPVPAPPLDPLPPSLDFPTLTAAAFEDLRRAGMHLVQTTDPITR